MTVTNLKMKPSYKTTPTQSYDILTDNSSFYCFEADHIISVSNWEIVSHFVKKYSMEPKISIVWR